MSNTQPSPTGEGRGGMELLFFGLIFAMLVFGLWYLIRVPLLYVSFYISFYCFRVYAAVYEWLPFLMSKGEYKELLSAIRFIPETDPTKHGFVALMTMFKIHGTIGRWFFIPLLLWWGWSTQKNVVRFRFRRKIGSVYKMIDIQSKYFPASAIIKGKNLLKTHPYVGPWATFALPLDFALDNQMLWVSKVPASEHTKIDTSTMFPIPPFSPEVKVLGFPHKRKLVPHYSYVVFNPDAAHDLFVKQLGEKWEGSKSLPPLERALYAIFCTQISGDQGKAWAMVEQIAFSWREGRFDDKGNLVAPHFADTKGVDELIAKHGNSVEVRKIEALHYHKYNVLQGLLGEARKKGRLMHSNLLWVKPMNRVLWYCLCGQGGQVAYWEAAGPWAHAQVERLMGRSIAIPMVAGAVMAFRTVMSREHWIDPAEFSEEAQNKLVKEANETIDNAKNAEKEKKSGKNAGVEDQDFRRRQRQQIEQNRAAGRRNEDDEP